MSETIKRAAAILGRHTFTMHTDRGLTVESFLSDREAAEALSQITGRDEGFAQSLLASLRQYGSWTPGKRAWAHKLALGQMFAAAGVAQPARDDRRVPAPVERPAGRPAPVAPRPAPQPSVNREPVVLRMDGIMRLFATALRAIEGRPDAKKPKITFAMEGGAKVVLSIAGERSRKPGTINVTNGKKYGEADNVWFGRIDPETGVFARGRDCSDKVVDFLKRFSEDPAGVAGRYGQRTGFCCFCHKELTRSRGTGPRCRALYSVDVGYGPDCARRFGLPFGLAAARAAESEAAVAEEAREEAVALAGQQT